MSIFFCLILKILPNFNKMITGNRGIASFTPVCYSRRGGISMETFLEKTAWPMTVPEPGSAFHLLFVLFGLAAALGFPAGPPPSAEKMKKRPFVFCCCAA